MINMVLAQSLSIPGDLELAIPGNIGFFKVLLVVSFVLHIIFVNLMIAGGVFAVFNEWRGWRSGELKWDRLAEKLAVQVSIHKSLAVVMGVAPLLIISVIYTKFFYPSTILIGKAWLGLILIITIGFLLLYVYKFTWERWMNKKGLHLLFGVSGTLMLLYVALVFITNVTSMLQPELWKEGMSVFTAFFHYPTIWQRFFHFLFATMAVMGIYLVILGGKTKQKDPDSGQIIQDFGKQAALVFTLLQLVAGPVLLFSLNQNVQNLFLGGSMLQTVLLSIAVILAVFLVLSLYKYKKKESSAWLRSSIILFLVVISAMGWLRHEVRESYLEPYQEQIAQQEAESGQQIVEK